MKVVWVSDDYEAKSGVGIQTHKILFGLRDKGHEVVNIAGFVGPQAGVKESVKDGIRKYSVVNTGDQSIVGVCELLRSFQNKFTAFIHSFYIDIPYRDKGTGKKLLREVIKILKADRIKYVELTVDPGNTAAMSFYRGFDFREVSVRKNEYGRGIDRILMRLKF